MQAVWQYRNLKQNLLQIGLNEGTLNQLSSPNHGGISNDEAQPYTQVAGHKPARTLRTIHIRGMARGTPLADYLAVVRGGPVLDSFVRPQDDCAVVSFVHAAHAAAFFKHVQTNGLHIHQTRARIGWAPRQFALRDFLAVRIHAGATRNLVVRQVDAAVTKQSIRADLDHIHRMVVTKVSFAAGNCYICTNSVDNAMYARTCMKSRQKFRHSRIDFFSDECAEPLEEQAKPSVPKWAANRFEVLEDE